MSVTYPFSPTTSERPVSETGRQWGGGADHPEGIKGQRVPEISTQPTQCLQRMWQNPSACAPVRIQGCRGKSGPGPEAGLLQSILRMLPACPIITSSNTQLACHRACLLLPGCPGQDAHLECQPDIDPRTLMGQCSPPNQRKTNGSWGSNCRPPAVTAYSLALGMDLGCSFTEWPSKGRREIRHTTSTKIGGLPSCPASQRGHQGLDVASSEFFCRVLMGSLPGAGTKDAAHPGAKVYSEHQWPQSALYRVGKEEAPSHEFPALLPRGIHRLWLLLCPGIG